MKQFLHAEKSVVFSRRPKIVNIQYFREMIFLISFPRHKETIEKLGKISKVRRNIFYIHFL